MGILKTNVKEILLLNQYLVWNHWYIIYTDSNTKIY